MTCPLCRSADVAADAEAHGRSWFRCASCALTFLHPAQHPDAEAERAHYGTHENDPQDAGYRRFLARLSVPLVARLPAGAEGLDFGAGPGPALAAMLREQGFRMRIFDPVFAPDAAVLERAYDFITATEVVEHFFRPREEFDRLDGMLRPGGWLGVMTGVRQEDRSLSSWRYARDPTHVCFYAPATLEWIAGHYGWRIERPHPDVALFRTPGPGALTA